ncbi:hypothetical protein YDYSY3_39270 [Paenibacillus chitinolyticus]|uniref:hypothetical protein n=1 Tax=Paenibacillus chitinolyticus TaxID=79263 RepID=UPI0026E4E8DF|nr:hypothetical protein [Paenibacillus chitinolyticus]GKS12927.1 hypothetical protein YDYSY3_39270 [Paenibacillus chitinolyticus]
MTAKEAFEKIGYKQIIYNENELIFKGIQYIKKDDDSEMERVGMLCTKYIEFYFTHKEIAIYTTHEHRNGNISKSSVEILNLEEYNAVKIQIDELEWQNK